MRSVGAVERGAEDERMAEPQAAEAANGVEEEPNNDDDVWGHTPASSVYGLDDDEDEFEPTPEESPYPLFAEDDIAGLPQDESEVGSIVEEGREFPCDEEGGGGIVEVRPDGCLSRACRPTRGGSKCSPRSLRRHGQQQDPRGERADDEGKS